MLSRTGFAHLPRKYAYFDDSPVILYLDEQKGTLYRSANDGADWDAIEQVPASLAQQVIMHPFDPDVGFLLGPEFEHYKTDDKGKSWHKFKTEDAPSTLQAPLSFNAAKPKYVLFAGERCDDKGGFWGSRCYDHTYYTEDGFKSPPILLREYTHSCVFARSTKAFKEAAEKLVICIDEDKDEKRKFPMNLQLTSSVDWYKSSERVSADGNPIKGVVGLGAVQTFIVAATKTLGSDEMSLYISDDGISWDQAEFPHDHGGLKEDAYTILESRPYGIQVDVMSSEVVHNSFGALYTSNSNGTYFSRNLEYTNRNELGIVDFENVENIQGIVLANVVANHEEVQKSRSADKKIQSRISFDDGRTWQALRAPKNAECDPDDASKCSLHLYSAAAPHNVGRIFSSTAPGILMGVGSVGTELLPYHDCNLFISDDAGATWRMTRTDAHKYEWGDQGSVVVAIFDEDTTDKIHYSFDRGQKWHSLDLGMKVRAHILTTVPDSTTEKFTLVASRGKGDESEDKVHVFSIDFSGMRSSKCILDKKNLEKSDFEKWYARTNSDGSAACILGHKQYFYRKKAERDCYVGESYKDPEPIEENCPSEEADYECDYDFIRKGKECVLADSSYRPDGACANGATTYRRPSGYKIIPGNTCDVDKGVQKEKEIEVPCTEADPEKEPGAANGQVDTQIHDFEGHVRQYIYLERTGRDDQLDETVLMQIDMEHNYVSSNGGQSWTRVLEGEEIVAVVPHKYFSDYSFYFTSTDKAFVTSDRGRRFKELELPSPPNKLHKPILDFHSTKSGWLIFTGMSDCETGTNAKCRATSYYTENAGNKWTELYDYVDTCQYIGTTKVDTDANLIYCAAQQEDSKDADIISLYSSVDHFKTSSQLFETIVGFAVFEEFIVVAEIQDTSLRMHASVDGETFAHGHFPPKFDVDQQQAYTVLDSVTKSIFLHITTNAGTGREFGSLLKSNSNGTYFVTSLDYVNRNGAGYVDFEKLLGLEGVALVNIVSNSEEARKGQRKSLRTMMTHNDGGLWSYLVPPTKDSEGAAYSCKGDLEDCSLNLHGYTERADYRDTYSSGSAIGFLLGVGNVGDSLLPYEKCDTFLSADGGITWSESHKGQYQWEFGDQGSIIVIVKDGVATNSVLYTLDSGSTWKEHKFAEEELLIRDIATVPSDTSRTFLLFAKPDTKKDEMRTIALDFSKLTNRQCNFTFRTITDT